MKAAKLGLLFLLAACAQAEITQPPIPVTPINSADAVGLDVYARSRSRGNPVPTFRGQDTITVRAFGSTDGRGNSELRGATCLLDSGLYRAQFQTPANIAVPIYGPDSPAIFVRCQTEGISGSMTVNAVNVTAQQRQNAAIGTGLIGAIVIGAVAAAKNDPANDEFAYPNISIQMR